MEESEKPPLSPGTLYVVPTPIGNMEDITFRAVRTLSGVDVIAAEDTRHTGILLKRLGISRPMLSYHKFNEAQRCEQIVGRLKTGEIVALVTDSGTPAISDPGVRVVRAVADAGFRVEALPGPCAFVTAVSCSGLPSHTLHFSGFLPQKSAQRLRVLQRLQLISATHVLYESPHRAGKLIGELATVFPDRPVAISRELTKRFEEVIRGTAAELAEQLKDRSWKGEFVFLIDNNS